VKIVGEKVSNDAQKLSRIPNISAAQQRKTINAMVNSILLHGASVPIWAD